MTLMRTTMRREALLRVLNELGPAKVLAFQMEGVWVGPEKAVVTEWLSLSEQLRKSQHDSLTRSVAVAAFVVALLTFLGVRYDRAQDRYDEPAAQTASLDQGGAGQS